MFSMAPVMNPGLPIVSSNQWRHDHEHKITQMILALRDIFLTQVNLYTDFIDQERLFVEDLDNFVLVRDVNPQLIASNLDANERIDLSESTIKKAIESILGHKFNQGDWGGETNDLFTSQVYLNGVRRQAAFALKGRGLKSKELRIKDCGKNGDQISRLFTAPADLFVIQYVGRISEAVVKEAQTQVHALRSQGKTVAFCTIDGMDTARLLHAYGALK